MQAGRRRAVLLSQVQTVVVKTKEIYAEYCFTLFSAVRTQIRSTQSFTHSLGPRVVNLSTVP